MTPNEVALSQKIDALEKEKAEINRKFSKIMKIYSTIYKVLDLGSGGFDQGTIMLKLAQLIPQIQNNPDLSINDPEIAKIIAEYEASNC